MCARNQVNQNMQRSVWLNSQPPFLHFAQDQYSKFCGNLKRQGLECLGHAWEFHDVTLWTKFRAFHFLVWPLGGHVIEALWMEGVWSWAEHIQSHSFMESHPMVYEIAQVSRKNKNKNKKYLRWMKFWRMKNQCLQDEGVGCSSHRMRACVWNFWRFP